VSVVRGHSHTPHVPSGSQVWTPLTPPMQAQLCVVFVGHPGPPHPAASTAAANTQSERSHHVDILPPTKIVPRSP